MKKMWHCKTIVKLLLGIHFFGLVVAFFKDAFLSQEPCKTFSLMHCFSLLLVLLVDALMLIFFSVVSQLEYMSFHFAAGCEK